MTEEKRLELLKNSSQTIHELKTWPEYFEAIFMGKKTFEIRKNDRDFKVGDYVILKEWHPKGFSSTSPNEMIGEYSGREMARRIIYILPSNPFVQLVGHIIFSIA